MAAQGDATIGGVLTLELDDAVGGALGYWLAGIRAVTPLFGGEVLVVPAIVLPVPLAGASGVAGAGNASLPLTIPNNVLFVGTSINFQAAVIDSGAVQGVALTPGVELWIG